MDGNKTCTVVCDSFICLHGEKKTYRARALFRLNDNANSGHLHQWLFACSFWVSNMFGANTSEETERGMSLMLKPVLGFQ